MGAKTNRISCLRGNRSGQHIITLGKHKRWRQLSIDVEGSSERKIKKI